jgi:hypothetical protein
MACYLRGSPGFREMSLEERRSRCRLTQFRAAEPPSAGPLPTGKILSVDSLNGQQPR